MSELWLGLLLVGVVALNGLLAATRNALVNSRLSQLKDAAQKGDRRAESAASVVSNATELLMGFRLAQGLTRLLTYGLAVWLALALTGAELWGVLAALAGAALIVGLTDLALESMVLRNPEGYALSLTPIARAVVLLMKPLMHLVMKVTGSISGLGSGWQTPLVTEEEIMTLVDAGEEGGAIEEEEKEMIYSIFQLGNTLAREVMIPRIDIEALEEHTTVADATMKVLDTGHSRLPVYSEAIDNILGILHAKDLLTAWQEGRATQVVAELTREALFVPEAKKVDDLLEELQERQIQMAIVVDEYGGTAGVVTLEDIVEEIIGEVRDEYDRAEEHAFLQLAETEFIFSGGIDLDDVNQLTSAELPKGTSETLAGFVYAQLGRVPGQGETIRAGGLELTVEQVVGRRIRKVRARILPPAVTESKDESVG
jgi:putative hemolysin